MDPYCRDPCQLDPLGPYCLDHPYCPYHRQDHVEDPSDDVVVPLAGAFLVRYHNPVEVLDLESHCIPCEVNVALGGSVAGVIRQTHWLVMGSCRRVLCGSWVHLVDQAHHLEQLVEGVPSFVADMVEIEVKVIHG